MIVYRSLDAFLGANGDQRKWELVSQALRKSRELPTRWARSLRDSITYWVEDGAEESAAPTGRVFASSRAYQTVIMPLDGPCILEIAEVRDLLPVVPYDDQTDCLQLAGDGEHVALSPGEIAVIGVDQAWRIAERSGALVHLRVTVLGPTARKSQ